MIMDSTPLGAISDFTILRSARAAILSASCDAGGDGDSVPSGFEHSRYLVFVGGSGPYASACQHVHQQAVLPRHAEPF